MAAWQWLILGAMALLNLAAVLIVVRATRKQVRRLGSAVRRAARRGGGVSAAPIQPETADRLRRAARLAAQAEARLAERAVELRQLVTAADRAIAELRQLSPRDAGPRDRPAGGGNSASCPSPRRAEVLRLAAQHVDVVEIARRVGMDVGEVELVLSLYGAAGLERA